MQTNRNITAIVPSHYLFFMWHLSTLAPANTITKHNEPYCRAIIRRKRTYANQRTVIWHILKKPSQKCRITKLVRPSEITITNTFLINFVRKADQLGFMSSFKLQTTSIRWNSVRQTRLQGKINRLEYSTNSESAYIIYEFASGTVPCVHPRYRKTYS